MRTNLQCSNHIVVVELVKVVDVVVNKFNIISNGMIRLYINFFTKNSMIGIIDFFVTIITKSI